MVNASSAPLLSGFVPPFDPSGSGAGLWNVQGAFPTLPPPSGSQGNVGDDATSFSMPSGTPNGGAFFPTYDAGAGPWDGAGNPPMLGAVDVNAEGAGLAPMPPPFFFIPANEESPEMKAALMWQNVALNFDYW